MTVQVFSNNVKILTNVRKVYFKRHQITFKSTENFQFQSAKSTCNYRYNSQSKTSIELSDLLLFVLLEKVFSVINMKKKHIVKSIK